METPESIWYACYGSNLRFERLRCYLRGGVPEGSTGRQPGALDSADPFNQADFSTNWTLSFARESANWDGQGVAFLSAPAGETLRPELSEVLAGQGTLCRVYQLTFAQFLDVLLQENDCDPRSSPEVRETVRQLLVRAVPNATPGHGFDLPVGVLADGWYRRVVRLGQHQGEPVFTFTTDRDLPRNPPAPAYLRVMALGLFQTYRQLTAAQIGAYLARTSGLPADAIAALTQAAEVEHQARTRLVSEAP